MAYCSHTPTEQAAFGTYTTAQERTYCRNCHRRIREVKDTASSPGVAANVVQAGAIGLGIGINMVKLSFTIFGLAILAIAIWGYHRAHTEEFKYACAAYQNHLIDLSFPDNLLCETYWQLK